jgi:hypothetical protein
MRHFRLFALLLLSGTVSSFAADDPFPKPNPAKAFPELKIYDDAGRPWRVAREDWTGARQRVTSDPAWAAWLKAERAAVDDWIPKHHDRVDWAAGWSHDGVAPDGSRLIWTDQIPGEEISYVSSRTQAKVEITPKIFGWWVVSFRGRNVSLMERAAQLYHLTGEKQYATWAAGQLDFYADNYLKWAPARGGARLFWQTLTEASNVLKMAEVVRLLGDFATPEHRQRWREKLFDPEVIVLNSTYQNIHNIACAQRNAVAHIALVFGDDALWRQSIDGPWGIRQQVRFGITSDYLWDEQSFGYNGLVLGVLTSLFTTAGIYGHAHELSDEMAVAENLLLAPTYYRFPNGDLPNPADSTGIPTAPNLQTFASVYRVFPTTLGLAAVNGRRSWDTLLDPPPLSPLAQSKPIVNTASHDDESSAEGARADNRKRLSELGVALPPVISRNLESTRMAILKQGAWQVFFHYGQLTRSHSESEALNFSAYFGDTDITHDAGTAPYGSPLHLGYFTRGLAHNVPLVNGEGEDLGGFGERREWIVELPDPKRPMRGQLLEYSESPARVSAGQPIYRKGVHASRTLSIDGAQLIDHAVVDCAAATPQKLGLALHLQGKVTLPDNFQADATLATGRAEPFTYWKDPRVAAYRDSAEFEVSYGKLVMRVRIACPGEFKIWHAVTPDVPPRQRESFYLETIGTRVEFTTTFAPK